MDEYKDWAARYFKAFEGRALYPSLKTWHWYALALASLGVFYLALNIAGHAGASQRVRTLAIAGSGCALASILIAIDSFKSKAALAAAQAEFGTHCKTLDDCRVAALRHICGADQHKFASLAKECSDLLALQRAHRPPEELNLGYYLRKVYDPDSKGRLLTIVMGSLALFTALLSRSLPAEYPSILEVLADHGVWQFTWLVVSVSVMLFGLWLAGQAITLMAVTKTSVWWTKLTGSEHRSDVALRYFLRDLIRFHRSSVSVEPGLTQPAMTKISANDDETDGPTELAQAS